MVFEHIHIHSDYSILDGFGQVEEYALKAKKLGMKHIVVTDHGMGAVFPKQIESASKYDLIPIYGCEIYHNDYNHLKDKFNELDKQQKELVRRSDHLILLAKNNTGYKNLVKIISDGWINGFYYKPRVSFDFITQYSEGLICTSACIGSKLNRFILNNNLSEAIDEVLRFKKLFNDDYYLEIQLHNIKEQYTSNRILIELSKNYNIPLVLTNDIHYAEKEDSEFHKMMLAINSNGEKSFDFHCNDLWFKSEEEMDETWSEYYKDIIPEELYLQSKLNTEIICSQCHVEIDSSPKFPEIENAHEILMDKCVKGLKAKNLHNNEEYINRLNYEYNLISDKGYESYFLIVEDVINFVKSKNKSIGPARGSAAGSLISYLLGITQIDPIKHGLIFERFLNPSRGGKFAKLQFSKNSKISENI